MKKNIIFLATLLMMLACGNSNNAANAAQANEDSIQASESEATVQAPINTMVIGDISADAYNEKATATVKFDRFPTTLDDFVAVQKNLGHSIAGSVALTLMAYQLYYYDQKAGEEAIKLCNCSSNVNSTMSVLKQKFRKALVGKDSYCQPWLVATYLEGATPQNAYKPNHPYIIKVRTNPVRKYETLNSPTFKGYIYSMQVYCNGADTAWRTVDVCKEKGKNYFTMFNCPNLYVGVKEIALECDDDFTEIH